MTETKFRFDKGMVKTVVTLLAFAAVVAFLLGLVNDVTAENIAKHKADKTMAAMETVLPAGEYSQVIYEGDPSVASVYRAGDDGWIVEVTPSGFGGLIDMMVGVDKSGAVTGVSIVSMSETSGLGANASRESFRSQYVGKTGSVKLKKQGGEIDALTGATVTSTAVTKGVDTALGIAVELMKGGTLS
jgi:electron transport complex protein RnfG